MIEVDGGVKKGSIKKLADIGVDLAVVGSGVFNTDSTRFFSSSGQGTTQQRLASAGVSYTVNSTTLTITNNMIGELFISKSGSLGQTFSETGRSYVGGEGIAYAFLIFDLEGG